MPLAVTGPTTVTLPTAPVVAPGQVAVRRLKMFTRALYATRMTHDAAESKAQLNGPRQEGDQILKPGQCYVHGPVKCCACSHVPGCRGLTETMTAATTGPSPRRPAF